MKYRLHNVGPTSYELWLGRKVVGRVWQHVQTKRWYGKIETKDHTHRADAETASAAFTEVVKVANRVAICGENDAAKARATYERELAERNAQVVADVTAWNALLADAPAGVRALAEQRIITRRVRGPNV